MNRITSEQREAIVRDAIGKRDALLADCSGGSPCTGCPDKRQCGKTGCIRQPEHIGGGGISATPLSDYPPEDQAFFRFWYGHMRNEIMRPPLRDVSHATARYIWDAAQSLTMPSPAGSPADRSVVADEQEASAGKAGPEGRDWPEDEARSWYQNRCRQCEELFLGDKRRALCKLCCMPPDETRDPQPSLTVTRDPQGQAGPAQLLTDARRYRKLRNMFARNELGRELHRILGDARATEGEVDAAIDAAIGKDLSRIEGERP